MAIVISKSFDSKSLKRKLLAASGGGLVICTLETVARTEHSEASSQLCSASADPQQSLPLILA